jgi:hypothetical protein
MKDHASIWVERRRDRVRLPPRRMGDLGLESEFLSADAHVKHQPALGLREYGDTFVEVGILRCLLLQGDRRCLGRN